MLELRPESCYTKKHVKNCMARLTQSAFFKNHSTFIWVITIGIFLRVLFIEFQGLSNDELSAWYRTRYIDWNSFWYFGVKSGDMHPVFYQAFLHFWTQLFGDSEWALRSTGIFFYLLNSLLIYNLCIRFFTKNTGLALLTLYTCLVFTIINTTLARPYNSGTFFLLLSFWSILELGRTEKRISKWHFGIILGFIGAMTSHYFAFLTAGIIGILSFIYLPKKKLIEFLICGALAILLFIPHWSVTEHQLNQGGLGWLAAPKWNWLVDFFHQFFNFSWLNLLLIGGGIVFYNFYSKTKEITKEEKFSISIFSFTYIIAHIISLLYTPILRELVMLYLLPFLFIFLFRKIELIGDFKLKILYVFFPLIVGIQSIAAKGLLEPENFGVFREIGHKINLWKKNINLNECTTASNYNNIGYLNYYLKTPLKESITDWSKPDIVYQLAERAKKSDKKYFMYTWSNNFHLPMFYEVIQKYYPSTIDSETYFGSSFRLYSKNGKRKLNAQEGILPKTKPLTSSEEFIGEVKIEINNIASKIQPNHYILLQTEGKLSTSSPLYFVATLERNGEMVKNGNEPLFYQAFDQSKLNNMGVTTNFLLAFDLPKEALSSDLIKIYFWNPDKNEVEIGETKMYFEKD